MLRLFAAIVLLAAVAARDFPVVNIRPFTISNGEVLRCPVRASPAHSTERQCHAADSPLFPLHAASAGSLPDSAVVYVARCSRPLHLLCGRDDHGEPAAPPAVSLHHSHFVPAVVHGMQGGLFAAPCGSSVLRIPTPQLPYMPRFLASGSNAVGIGHCNKTALALNIASRTAPCVRPLRYT